MKNHGQITVVWLTMLALTACTSEERPSSDPNNPASAATLALQAEVRQALQFDDRVDISDADRALIARDNNLLIRAEGGRVVWDPSAYAFETGGSPPTVNPSLWRQVPLPI